MQLGVCTNISSNTARGQNVEAIPEFVCLGSVLSSEGRCTGEWGQAALHWINCVSYEVTSNTMTTAAAHQT